MGNRHNIDCSGHKELSIGLILVTKEGDVSNSSIFWKPNFFYWEELLIALSSYFNLWRIKRVKSYTKRCTDILICSIRFCRRLNLNDCKSTNKYQVRSSVPFFIRYSNADPVTIFCRCGNSNRFRCCINNTVDRPLIRIFTGSSKRYCFQRIPNLATFGAISVKLGYAVPERVWGML